MGCKHQDFEEATAGLINRMILLKKEGVLPDIMLRRMSSVGTMVLESGIEKRLVDCAKYQNWVELVNLLNQHYYDQEKICLTKFNSILAKIFEGSVQAGPRIANIAFQGFMTHFLMQKQNLLPIEHDAFSQLGGTFIVHLYESCFLLDTQYEVTPDPLQVLEYMDLLKMKPWQFCTIYIPESSTNSNAIRQRIEPYKVLLTCISVWATGNKVEQLKKAYDLLYENTNVLRKSDIVGQFFVAKRLFDSFIHWLDNQNHDILSKSIQIYSEILFPFVEDQLNNGIEEFKGDVFEKYFNILLYFALLSTKGTDTDMVASVLLPFIQKHQSKAIFEEGSIRGLVHLLRLGNHKSVKGYYEIGVAHGVYPETCIDHFESSIEIVANMTYQEMRITLEEGLKAITDLITRDEVVRLYQATSLNAGDGINHQVLKSIENFSFAVEIMLPRTVPKATNFPFIDSLSASTISDAYKRLNLVLEHEIQPRVFVKISNTNKYFSKKDIIFLEPHSFLNYSYKRVLNMADESPVLSRVTFR